MDYKTEPMAHQREGAERFHQEEYGALFWEMGSGKTKTILDVVGNGPCDGIMVLAPNGLHLNWDAIEVEKHLPCNDYVIYCWRGKPTTQKAKRELLAFNESTAEKKIWLMNVEAIRNKSGLGYAVDFMKSREHTELIIDESTCIKNHKAAQSKAAMILGKMATRRWILNGTPITQGPLDLWSQCQFLSKGCLPYSTWTGFKNMFAIEEIRTMQNRMFKQIIGYQNLERLKEDIKPFSSRILKEDCMDLPEKTFMQRAVELTAEQRKIYSEVKDLCLSELDNGSIVSVTIALAKIVKLHQILCGFVIDDGGTTTDIPNNRLAAVAQIAETTKPLVIFCAYRRNIDQVADMLRKEYGDSSVVEYHGGTNTQDRQDAVRKFQNGEADFFLGTSAAAKGLTLHRAHTMVYYANTYSLEARLQSQDRIHRHGQKNECTYIDLVVPDSLDQMIIDRLTQKKDLADMVLTDLQKAIQA
jgi:SNF2 family DNA or RNA helicase